MSQMRRLQLTLALLKPDVMSQPHIAQEIKRKILDHDFYFVKSRMLQLSQERVGDFYSEHKGKFFYHRLMNYMSSGHIGAHILAHPNAIPLWRKIMGPTKVFKSIHNSPASIRGRFGLSDTRNCTHGSDSEESARQEILFFFPEFNMEEWYESEEEEFRLNHVKYSPDADVHLPWKKC